MTRYLPSKKSIDAERIPSTVGLYTSPHLRFVRERIKIDNEPISEELFAECFWEVWDRLEATKASAVEDSARGTDSKPVYFRYLTLMALHCYLQQQVGTAVIECGIGGEYDSTNILIKPAVTGVTSLGIDHEVMLGNTIEQIAWHKAGIFKPGVPAFTVEQPAEALEVLHQRAKERQTELYVVPVHSAVAGMELGLQGHFQTLNASLAVAISALHLARLGFSNVPDPYDPHASLPDEFIEALRDTRLGGRCDRRSDTTSPNVTWYIDGGHTLESIDVAARWFVSKLASCKGSEARRVLVFNQQTRDAAPLARRLHETLAIALSNGRPFEHVIFCPNTTYRDAGYKADLVSINTNKDDVSNLRVQHELAKTWDAIDPEAHVHVVSTIEEAVNKAREIADGERTEVLATGSLHLVGGLIEVLETQAESNNGRL